MQCALFDAARCRSCSELATPYAIQLAAKDAAVRQTLRAAVEVDWRPPCPSAEHGFRNKAKMVVSGSIEAPVLGILDARFEGVDLADCPLYPPALGVAFEPIREFIRSARILPYDVLARRGELKYVLITLAEHSGELMLRFVLRSQEALGRIRKQLPSLQQALPQARVISVNLQPEPKAIVEGSVEIMLSACTQLEMRLNGIDLLVRPQSFFQTNTQVAEALYREARDWVAAIGPGTLWDLYCGVGGFALHCHAEHRQVRGMEVSAEAVSSARASAEAAGLPVAFEVIDATCLPYSPTDFPDLLIVNPPRRGLGAALCAQIAAAPTRSVLYSSCNAESLAADLSRLAGLSLRRARVFDMFPHTRHAEVLVLLQRDC